ncbi:MAG: LysM peptidoglycan-binding domain-containing protein, partial [Rhizobacter sp.]
MLPADAVRRSPVAAPPPPPPPPPAAPPARHVEHKVQRGETLSEISTRYRTTPQQLQTSNPDIGNPDQLRIDQTVRVPIGEGYGVEPIEREVKPGETLADLAAQYRQPPVDLARANRHNTGGTQEPLVVGQKVWIPGTRSPDVATTSAPAPTPLEAKVQATDAAAQRVAEAQRQYDDMNASTQGRGAAVPWLQDNLNTARKELDTAVQAEVALRAGPGATD